MVGRVRVPSSRALEAAEAARLESEARSARQQPTTTSIITAAKKAAPKSKPTPANKASVSKGKGKGKLEAETTEEGEEEIDDQDGQASELTSPAKEPDMTLCK